MNYSNLIKIAFSALKRNKTRTFLTMLGIIIGVGSVIAMLAIGQGSKISIQSQVSNMGTNLVFVMPGSQNRGGVQMGNSNNKNLTPADVQAIKNSCPALSMVSPEVRGAGQAVFGNQNWPTSIYGANEDYLEIRKYSIASGRMFNEREIATSAKVCVIGKTVIKNLFGENADPIGQTIRYKKIPFKIIGVLAEKGQNTFGQDQDDMIIAPYTTVQKRILAITYFHSINASAYDNQSKQAMDQMEQCLRSQHKIKEGEANDFEIRSQEELVKTLGSISDVLTILLGAIASISLLVGGIGIMNIMYVSVTERTKEIGLRLAVGGKGKNIMLQFLVESILISVSGGILGVLLGILLALSVTSIMNWPVIISLQSVMVSFLVCTAIGMFFGWYPARRAANLDPIESLRYE